jgi:hypothetical protein
LIKERVLKSITPLKYAEHKYWATLRNPKTKHNIAYMHPTAGQIRIFNKTPIIDDEPLDSSPSSGAWKEEYPSVCTVRSEVEISKAVGWIAASYGFDLARRS